MKNYLILGGTLYDYIFDVTRNIRNCVCVSNGAVCAFVGSDNRGLYNLRSIQTYKTMFQKEEIVLKGGVHKTNSSLFVFALIASPIIENNGGNDYENI